MTIQVARYNRPMVAVAHSAPVTAAPAALAAWLEQAGAAYSADERTALAAAVAFARERYGDVCTGDGEPWLDRALGTAAIVGGLKLDAISVRAAVLLGVPHCEGFDEELFKRDFGAELRELVIGVARMGAIRATPESRRQGRARRARPRTCARCCWRWSRTSAWCCIKLAERTQALRFLMGGDETARTQAARETQDLFAPLANRLGVWQLKWELEDLALRALEPETYQQIAALLDERRLDREHYIEDVKRRSSASSPPPASRREVTGRPKHIYSIWNKMRRKRSGIDSVYDIRAVRVLVDDVKDCYAALGVVHNLWTPMPREFDDYIAKPKANDYRSLHTAVIGPEGKALEVQIRTHEMHQHSEYGVAAHWRYKEGARRRAARSRLRREDRVAAPGARLEGRGRRCRRMAAAVQVEPVHRHDLRAHAAGQRRRPAARRDAGRLRLLRCTPSLGHRCRGARVDGAMVPLNYALQNGQRVEIIAAKQGGPSRDWLNPELGYLQSHRARAKVRQWFKAQQLEETIAQGRDVGRARAARAGHDRAQARSRRARSAGFAKLDDFFAAVARKEINTRAAADRDPVRWHGRRCRAGRRRCEAVVPRRARPQAPAAASSSSASIA